MRAGCAVALVDLLHVDAGALLEHLAGEPKAPRGAGEVSFKQGGAALGERDHVDERGRRFRYLEPPA